MEPVWTTGKRVWLIHVRHSSHHKHLNRGILHSTTPSAAGEVLVRVCTGALLSQEMKNDLEAQSQCRHLQEGRRP